jgi:hypothetical protein
MYDSYGTSLVITLHEYLSETSLLHLSLASVR